MLTEPRPLADNPVPDAQAIIEEARRLQRRRQRRMAVLIVAVVVVLGAVALFSSTSVVKTTAPTHAGRGTPTGAPLVGSPTPLTLDLFWSVPTEMNVSVNLTTGAVRTLSSLGLFSAVAREGYLLGITTTYGVGTFSYDLRHTFSTWTGRYGANPVPANDPRDVWVSSQAGTATEVNRSGQPVAPTVAIPPLTVVEGQSGPNLVLMGSPPQQQLELWSPTQQRILAMLGSQEYSAAVPAVSANSIVWSNRNVVTIDQADGVRGPVLLGPSGDDATFLAVSPDGSKVAVVFEPSPGTPGAGKGGSVVVEDIASGLSTTVSGSNGALNLLAWSPDGGLVFFPRLNPAGTSVTMATYRIGSRQVTPLPIPGLHIPATLNGAWGSVIVGKAATGA